MARKRSRRSTRRRRRSTAMAAAPRRRRRRGVRRRRSPMAARRRSLRGLGALPSWVRPLVPPAVGGGVTAGTTMAIRAFVNPAAGKLAAVVYDKAPLFGIGGGLAASAALGAITKRKADAIASATSAVVTGGVLFAVEKMQNQTAALAAGAGNGTAGMGLILPERASIAGLGEIMLEEGTSGLSNVVGEQVALAGLDAPNTDVFGVEAFAE